LLSSASSAAHATSHRAAEVLGALLPCSACLLLLLQTGLRPVGGLPSVATVLGPIAVLPVIAVNGTVLACRDVVAARSYAGASVGVVGKATPPGRALSGVGISHVSCAATSHNPCRRVVAHSSAPCDSIAGVDVGIDATAGYSNGATLRVLESGSTRCTVISRVGICPGCPGVCVSCIAPAAVHVGASIASSNSAGPRLT
jgi:hypothetical protein